MSKKTVSLQEFFRANGSPATYNNLPVRPRRASDDDQGLHLRLAQSCSLDSGKAYPQRNGPVSKEGPYADPYVGHGSYSGGDGAPVGDVDHYHRPHGGHAGPYHSSGSNSQYHAHRQGVPPRGPSPYDRPGQHAFEAPGPYRGPVSPAGMPPAGGPPWEGAGPVGAPVHPGSGYGSSYSGDPGYGQPASLGYGAAGGYGAPPQHPAGPYAMPPEPAARAGPGAPQQRPGPMGSAYAGFVPPHVLGGGGAGYGAPAPLYGAPPPPPPPPRQAPPQQVPVEPVPHVQVPVDARPALPFGSSRPAGTAPVGGYQVSPAAAPAPAHSAEALAPAGGRAAVAAQQPSAADAAATRKITPFAASRAEPAVEEPAVPPAPKNEFAERLAQRAMASAARAKSSLLAGGGSGALSSADSLGRADSARAGSGSKPPARGMLVDVSGAGGVSCGDSSNSSPTDPVLARPAHAFGRPKLALKPRAGSGNYSSSSSDSGDVPRDTGSGSAASSVSGGRPRLHLLPRGSSLGDSSTAGAAGVRKPSVFGDAKPREEVLKGRGLDPSLVDAAVDLGLNRRQAQDSSAGDRGSSLPSRRSCDDEEWHTVTGHGRRGGGVQRGGPALLVDDGGFDPFFGSGTGGVKPAAHSQFAPAPSSSFGREGYGGAGRRYGLGGEDGDDDDGGVFRRALPTRHVPLAL